MSNSNLPPDDPKFPPDANLPPDPNAQRDPKLPYDPEAPAPPHHHEPLHLHIPDLKEAEELVQRGGRRINIWLHSAIGTGVFLLLCVLGLAWYSNTPHFSRVVRQRVIYSIATATGGRVELGNFTWSVWHRSIVVDNLTIHGLEKPSEAPYMHIDRMEAQLRWSGFFFNSYVQLQSLRIIRPSVHLIVNADGTTNQPQPLHTMEPLPQTLIELAVKNISVEQGLAVINTHSIPIDFVARDTSLQLRYIPAKPRVVVPGIISSNTASPDANARLLAEHYTADFSSDDVHTRTYDESEVASQMSGHFTFAQTTLDLDQFVWRTPLTDLHATFSLEDFNHPQWHGAATGTIDVHQAAAITGIDGFSSGIVHLDLTAHSCTTVASNAAAQKNTLFPFLDQPHTASAVCNQAFILEGTLTGKNAAWKNSIVQVLTADAYTRVYVTPHEMDFLDMRGTLPDGGKATGNLHIYDYVLPALNIRGILDAQADSVPLTDVLKSLAPAPYSAIRYNTAATGPVHVEWSDWLKDAKVRASLQLHPVANQTGVPVTGNLQAAFVGSNSTIKIATLALAAPQSTLNLTGQLGIFRGDPLTSMHADLITHNLSELDSLVNAFIPHSSTSSALPVLLHGSAEYHGSVSGPIHQIDFSGHITASQIDLLANSFYPSIHWLPQSIHLDSLSADVDLSPIGLNIQQAHLLRGNASLDLSGQMHPEFITRDATHPHSTYSWDQNTSIDATLRTHDFPIADLISAPITGSLDSDAHITGTFSQIHASGQLTSRGGSIGTAQFSEPYRQLTATLSAQGTTWSLQKISLSMPAGTLTGDAAYDLNSRRTDWHLHTSSLNLSRIQSAAPLTGLTGELNLDASASGTSDNPGIQAAFTIHSLAMEGQSAGTLDATLRSNDDNLLYTLHSDAFGGHLEATGQTSLDAAYNTQLHAVFSSLDLTPILQLSRYQLTGQSQLGGELSLSGPLSDPAKLTGNASFDRFHIELSGVALDAAEPLHFSMASNILHLDQVHITGPDTNIRIQGSAGFGASGRSAANSLRLHSDGTINVKLLQTFDPDLVSSGHVEFTLNASGSLDQPEYSGSVHFNNASIALADFPNGLSQINGTLDFNRDSLEVRQLTAMTGGGQLVLGGTINLRGGIYADITARGQDNRIRYPLGVSSTANTDLRLQGSTSNALLSGTVLLTRFGLNQEFDLASLAATTTGVSAPPDPNAPSSHLRLDVHITSAPQLDFQNSYAKLAGDVDLELRGTIATPSLLGRINISEGSASFAGTKYQLQSGDITFNNPVRIEPLINLSAVTRVRDYDVSVDLHGPLANMHPTYRSEPPLSQPDILALLALGRTQEEAQMYQQQQEVGGADVLNNTLLGGALNQTVSNRAQRLFGVGSVKLDPTSAGILGNSSARITVEQSVSRNVTVTYATNVNETAEQLMQVTWDLTHTVSLVSQRDENGVYSMTFKIHQRHR